MFERASSPKKTFLAQKRRLEECFCCCVSVENVRWWVLNEEILEIVSVADKTIKTKKIHVL